MDKLGRRVVVGALIPDALIAIGIVPLIIWQDRFPLVLATTFDGAGRATGSSSWGVAIVIVLSLTVFPSLVTAAFAFRRNATTGQVWLPVGVSVFTAAIGAMAGLLIATANKDVLLWTQASGVGWTGAGVGICAAALLAVGAGYLGSKIEKPRSLPTYDEATVPTGGTGTWAGTVRSPVVIAAAIIMVFATAFTAWLIPGGPWIAVILGATTLVVATFTSVRIEINATGLHAYFVLPLWRTHIATERIRFASVERINPVTWGGWGYRGSLKVLRGAAIVMRSGPGIVLHLEDTKVFAVTIDDADRAAATINGLLEAAGTFDPPKREGEAADG